MSEETITLKMDGNTADLIFRLLGEMKYSVAQPIVDSFKAQIEAQQPKTENKE